MRNKKVLIIGLDGVDMSLIEFIIAEEKEKKKTCTRKEKGRKNQEVRKEVA